MADRLLDLLREMDAAIKSPARGGSLSAPDDGLRAMQALNDALPALVAFVEAADELRNGQTSQRENYDRIRARLLAAITGEKE